MKTEMQKVAEFQEVRRRYDAIQEHKKLIRDEIKRRVEAEYEEELTEFSKYLHEKHDGGMTWGDLSEACRKYTNHAEFKKLRDAWSPDSGRDLRSGNAVARDVDSLPVAWIGDTAKFNVDGETFFVPVVFHPSVSDEGFERAAWGEFDTDPEDVRRHYRFVADAVQAEVDERFPTTEED